MPVQYSATVLQAMLEALAAGAQPHQLAVQAGVVINVNFPAVASNITGNCSAGRSQKLQTM